MIDRESIMLVNYFSVCMMRIFILIRFWNCFSIFNFFFNPPVHLCAVTYITKTSLHVTLYTPIELTQSLTSLVEGNNYLSMNSCCHFSPFPFFISIKNNEFVLSAFILDGLCTTKSRIFLEILLCLWVKVIYVFKECRAISQTILAILVVFI